MKSSLNLKQENKIDREEAKKIKIIINCLRESNQSIDFREPVDWKGMGLTDYLEIINHPMDLSTVARKFKEDRYLYIEDVLDDLQLIWDNCKKYNPQASWIHSVAQKLERSFKKMVRNYFPDLNISLPAKIIQEQKQEGANYFDEIEDITYEQKLKLSEQLSHLSPDNLTKIIDQIIEKCPQAYRDTGDGKGQIFVDNMDLLFFNQITLQVRQLLNQGQSMEVEEEKPKRGRGRPPLNSK